MVGLLLLLQELLQIRERLVCSRTNCLCRDPEIGRLAPDMFSVLLVLPVVTIQTEVFPVAAVGRIVIVVVIFVVDGKLMQVLAREFTAAACAHPGKEAQRLLTVLSHTLDRAALCSRDDLIQFLAVGCLGHGTIIAARWGRLAFSVPSTS